MNKIDFHIHTVSTVSDSRFDFSLDTLSRYVTEAQLHAIAITNHDLFNLEQFETIESELNIKVFPGIEINLEKGHLLLISENNNLADFKTKADQVSAKIRNVHDCITVEELEEIYVDLGQYLLIPHYDKKPSLPPNIIEHLSEYIVAGEVSSPKKFIYAAKDDSRLTPVLFSDARMKEGKSKFPPRQTYIDCGDLTLDAIKQCLAQGKVALSENEGNKLYQIFDDGQMMSTGLNVLLGARSSGKTHTLDRLNRESGNAKYIRQFDLVQQDDAASSKAFESDVKTKRSEYSEDYLAGFRSVVDDVIKIDLNENQRKVDAYVDSLLKSATHADRLDAYANAALFNEAKYQEGDDMNLTKLIASVINVIENIDYRETIEKHIDLSAMKTLVLDLIQQLRDKAQQRKKKKFVNSLVKNIKEKLNMRTSAVAVEDIDFYAIAMDEKKVARFNEIINFLKVDKVINEEPVQGFTVVTKKQPFANATEAKKVIKASYSLTEAFKEYNSPYNYLRALLDIGVLPNTEIYKLFICINNEVLNREGMLVSGGERSEFRLLQTIKDAQSYDILLIDEPESSFDNGFLNSDVNQIIREISNTMPVVVVTHNNTVGASIGADYLLYASKEVENENTVHRLYSGYPTDSKLQSVDGRFKSNYTIMMDSLEAGEYSYNQRGKGYETIKNR